MISSHITIISHFHLVQGLGHLVYCLHPSIHFLYCLTLQAGLRARVDPILLSMVKPLLIYFYSHWSLATNLFHLTGLSYSSSGRQEKEGQGNACLHPWHFCTDRTANRRTHRLTLRFVSFVFFFPQPIVYVSDRAFANKEILHDCIRGEKKKTPKVTFFPFPLKLSSLNHSRHAARYLTKTCVIYGSETSSGVGQITSLGIKVLTSPASWSQVTPTPVLFFVFFFPPYVLMFSSTDRVMFI